jgi:serine/threonine protein kinase
VAEAFNGFTPSSVHLVETLLTIDPADRGTSTSALNSEFFTTEPLPCDPSSLPKYPPSKELNVKLRDEELRRYLILHLLCVFLMLMLSIRLMCNRSLLVAAFIVILGKRVLLEKVVVLMELEE